MIQNWELLQKLEDDFRREENLSYQKKLAIFEGMWNEAVSLGKLPFEN